MMTRWRAHNQRTGLARLAMILVPGCAAGVVLEIVLSFRSLPSAVGALLLLSVAAGVTRWAWLRQKAQPEVTLDGDVLAIEGYGRHVLRGQSLFALPTRETASSESVMGTLVVARLATGRPVAMLFATIVPRDLYLAEEQLLPDLWFDPDANELLDRLVPFLTRARAAGPPAEPGQVRGEEASTASYAMALRRRLLSLADVADSLSIVGDSIAIGRGGAVVASARAHEIAFTPYSFDRGGSLSGPDLPAAPAVLLHFMRADVSLSIGAHPMSLDSHWHHLPTSKAPDYLVGVGELMRLIDVLEAGRRRFAPGGEAPGARVP